MANKAVVIVGAPSYTSGAHIWKGATDSLNNKDTVIHILPKSPINTEFTPWILISPDAPYNKAHPNKKTPEDTAPKTKYFNPASAL